jgi:MoaA/NifB/PqqE/SkfB family radical SAM enzyme
MLKMKLEKEDIDEIMLDLNGVCNLKCPLCMRETPTFKHLIKKNVRSLEEVIAQIDEYPNLTKFRVGGIISEPTFYKSLIPLLVYLENRGIVPELYSHGNTHNEEWWYNLGQITKKTKVFFTICGSTQELHETYRVGSDLAQVHRHAAAFRRSGNTNDHATVLRFNYNADDIEANFPEMVKDFNVKKIYNGLPVKERFDNPTEVGLVPEQAKKYKIILNLGKQKYSSVNPQTTIKCTSLNSKSIYIDNFGKVFPCYMYKLSMNIPFDLDYTEILKYRHDFCLECEMHTYERMKNNDIEPIT